MILLVEDDLALRLAVGASLRADGHDVLPIATAEEAEAVVDARPPSAAVVDWNLPGRSGVELVRRWRAAGLGFPVLLLTARDAVADRVRGLDAGADDYLVKPFATEELLARVRALLRRRGADTSWLELAGCKVDLVRGEVHRGGQVEVLTTKELELLRFLAARPNDVVERETLHREVWGLRSSVWSRSADHTMARLRARVEVDPSAPRHLLTSHGRGYRFVP